MPHELIYLHKCPFKAIYKCFAHYVGMTLVTNYLHQDLKIGGF